MVKILHFITCFITSSGRFITPLFHRFTSFQRLASEILDRVISGRVSISPVTYVLRRDLEPEFSGGVSVVVEFAQCHENRTFHQRLCSTKGASDNTKRSDSAFFITLK